MTARNASALTTARLLSAATVVFEATVTLDILRKSHPWFVGQLPERLAVLQGLIQQAEGEAWEAMLDA